MYHWCKHTATTAQTNMAATAAAAAAIGSSNSDQWQIYRATQATPHTPYHTPEHPHNMPNILAVPCGNKTWPAVQEDPGSNQDCSKIQTALYCLLPPW